MVVTWTDHWADAISGFLPETSLDGIIGVTFLCSSSFSRLLPGTSLRSERRIAESLSREKKRKAPFLPPSSLERRSQRVEGRWVSARRLPHPARLAVPRASAGRLEGERETMLPFQATRVRWGGYRRWLRSGRPHPCDGSLRAESGEPFVGESGLKWSSIWGPPDASPRIERADWELGGL